MRLLTHTTARRAHLLGSLALSAALVLGATPTPALARQEESAQKAETVYVTAAADGSAQKVTSRVVLANDSQADALADVTTLTDLSSDTTYVPDPTTDALTWQAGGKEVQYEGTATAELPVTVHVTYTLDGVTVSPAQLAGKSGHLAIRYGFENASWSGSIVGGQVARIYTPFAAVATVTLDHDVFANVSVENGKLTDGSGSSMAIGYALPGLQESLDLSADDITLPDHFTIEADVTDFELGAVTVIVTPGLLSGMDTSDLDTADLTDGIDALADAVDALASGSDTLTDALGQIAEGQDTLVSGIGTFKEQAGALPEATGALSAGASALAEGLSGATAGAEGVAQGASAVSQLVDAASTAVEQASACIQAAAGNLSGAASSISAAQDEVAALQEGLSAQVAVLQGLLADEELTEAQAAGIQAAIDALEAVDLTTLADSLSSAGASVGEAQTGLGASDSTGPLGAVTGLLAQATGLASQVSDGASELAGGLAGASSGASDLASGMDQLDATAPQVVSGIDALQSGAAQLAQAIRAAAEGSGQLSSGLGQLGSEGIDKLSDTFGDELTGMTDRLDAVVEAADAYDTFSGKPDGLRGSVTFIYKLDAIEA